MLTIKSGPCYIFIQLARHSNTPSKLPTRSARLAVLPCCVCVSVDKSVSPNHLSSCPPPPLDSQRLPQHLRRHQHPSPQRNSHKWGRLCFTSATEGALARLFFGHSVRNKSTKHKRGWIVFLKFFKFYGKHAIGPVWTGCSRTSRSENSAEINNGHKIFTWKSSSPTEVKNHDLPLVEFSHTSLKGLKTLQRNTHHYNL